MTVALNNPKYEDVDLAQFDNDYAGQKVRVVVNPSRAFRAAYNNACISAIAGLDDKEFIEHLAVILDMPASEAGAYVNALPPDAAQWLFFYTVDDFDGKVFRTSIKPHLYQVWEGWVTKRVKARAAQGVKPESNETQPSAAEDQ